MKNPILDTFRMNSPKEIRLRKVIKALKDFGSPPGPSATCLLVRNTSGITLKAGEVVQWGDIPADDYVPPVDSYQEESGDPAGVVDWAPTGIPHDWLFWLNTEGFLE